MTRLRYSYNIMHIPRQLFVRCIHSPRLQSKRSINPLLDLQPISQVPILPPEDLLFQPSLQEIQQAQQLFSHKQQHQFVVHKGAVRVDDLPQHKQQEVAFIGRSNVGKSSLIKALYEDISRLKVSISKSPGHTKVIKMYEMKKHFCLVDLPGYGYNMPKHFVNSVETYLQNRQNVSRIFLLVDSEVGLTSTDRIGLEMLQEFSRPFTIVLTKQDKAHHHKLLRTVLSLRPVIESMHTCFPQPFLVSSQTGAGMDLLRAYIAYMTGNLQVQGH